MVNLQVVGALERCQTFGNGLNLNAVAHMPIPEDGARAFMEENLQAARLTGQQELARAIESSLGRRQGGIVERLRQGDLRHRVGKRIHRSLGRIPPYNWELSDIRLVQ